MAYAQPSSPQSIGNVIDDGIRLFGTAFRSCWLLAVIPGLLYATYHIAAPRPVTGHSLSQLLAQIKADFASPRVIAISLLNLLLTYIFQGAVIVREIAITRHDSTCTFGRAIERSLQRLPGMLLATILYGLAAMAGLIALAIVGGLLAAVVPGFLPLLHAYRWVAILFALVLLALGLLITVRLQLWTITLFAENASALGALTSSWRLTDGHWWRAATILSIAVIMIIVLAMCFSLVGGTVAAVGHLSRQASTSVIYLVWLGSNAVYYPLGAAIGLAMYHDFKLRRDGSDLERRVHALDGTT